MQSKHVVTVKNHQAVVLVRRNAGKRNQDYRQREQEGFWAIAAEQVQRTCAPCPLSNEFWENNVKDCESESP